MLSPEDRPRIAGALFGCSVTHVATDATFDVGQAQWHLIVYSWVPPTGSLAMAISGLRPGGIVVVEGATPRGSLAVAGRT